MEQKNRKIFFFCVFLIVFSFLATSSPFASLSKKIALNASSLPIKLVSLSFLPFQALFDSSTSLNQNRVLKKENQQLKVKLMQLQESEAENKRLSRLLEFRERPDFSLVVSRVIALDASNLRRSLIIDKGKISDIKIGNPVITSDGVVGMVVEVAQSVSRIILINDMDFSMAAKVQLSKAIGVISGSLEGSCKLKYLDLDQDIKAGDEVVSSGKNSRFPAGIPVGNIVEVSKDESGLTLSAIIKPKVRLSSLEEVLVIINY